MDVYIYLYTCVDIRADPAFMCPLCPNLVHVVFFFFFKILFYFSVGQRVSQHHLIFRPSISLVQVAPHLHTNDVMYTHTHTHFDDL